MDPLKLTGERCFFPAFPSTTASAGAVLDPIRFLPTPPASFNPDFYLIRPAAIPWLSNTPFFASPGFITVKTFMQTAPAQQVVPKTAKLWREQAEKSMRAANLRTAIEELGYALVELRESLPKSRHHDPGPAEAVEVQWAEEHSRWIFWSLEINRLTCLSSWEASSLDNAHRLIVVLREMDRDGYANLLHHIMEYLGEHLFSEAEYRARKVSPLRAEAVRMHDRVHDAIFWECPPIGHVADDGNRVRAPFHGLFKSDIHALEDALGLPQTDPALLFQERANSNQSFALAECASTLEHLWRVFQETLRGKDDGIKAYHLRKVTRNFDRIVHNFFKAYECHYVFPKYLERIITAFFLRLETANDDITSRGYGGTLGQGPEGNDHQHQSP